MSLCFLFSSKKIREQEGGTGSAEEGGGVTSVGGVRWQGKGIGG
jgi:hypothetical protein